MHKVYLYRDIWKGIETCQHQKARQHFIACKSEQEHSCQIWSSAGKKSLLPIFILFTSEFTQRQVFSQLSFWFLNGMNSDSLQWVGLQRLKAEEPGERASTRFGPQYCHLQQGGGWDPPPLAASLPSPAPTNSPDLKEGLRGAGIEEKRTRTVLLYFHMLKTKALWLFAMVRTSLCSLSACAVGMWHWPQPCWLDPKGWTYITAAESRKWFSFKA